MGSSVDPLESITAEYVAGILGNSVWDLYRGRSLIGSVRLNAVTKTATFYCERQELWIADAFMLREWSWWMKWLRKHRHEPF